MIAEIGYSHLFSITKRPLIVLMDNVGVTFEVHAARLELRPVSNPGTPQIFRTLLNCKKGCVRVSEEDGFAAICEFKVEELLPFCAKRGTHYDTHVLKVRISANEELYALGFETLKSRFEFGLRVYVVGWVGENGGEEVAVLADREHFIVREVDVLPNDTVEDVLRELQVRLATDHALLHQVDAVRDYRHFDAVKIGHHGPVRPLLLPKALVCLRVVQRVEYGWTAIDLLYFGLSQLARPPTSPHNQLALAQFQQVAMLDVPHDIVQAERVQALWHGPDLLGIAHGLMQVPPRYLRQKHCQLWNIVLDKAMIRIEADNVIVAGKVWWHAPSKQIRLN